MVFGGIPYYPSLINTKESLAQNVARLFFAQGGIMRVSLMNYMHGEATMNQLFE